MMTATQPPSKAWAIVSQWLPPRSPDLHLWWQLTGLHLSYMVDAAGYSIEKQIEALLFHYHWIVSKALCVLPLAQRDNN